MIKAFALILWASGALADPMRGLPEAMATMTTMAEGQALLAHYGLGSTRPNPAPALPFPPGGKPRVELVDIRLLLAQIAVQTGAKDHLVLSRAQGPGAARVLLLRGGLVTWTGLAALIKASPAAGDLDGGTLSRALVIWPDAGLALGPADRVTLSAARGAFLANLGRLEVRGLIAGSQAPNLSEPAFRPFVLTAGQGSFLADTAIFSHLGFGQTRAFAGVAIDNSGLKVPLSPPDITGSIFVDAGLALVGTTDALVQGNRLGETLIAHGLRTTLADNWAKGAGLRLTAGSDGTLVAGNVAQSLSIDQSSRATLVRGNLLSGLRASKTDCLQVTGNLVALGAGISLSDTGRVAITGNAILGNTGAGILLRAQGPGARVTVSGNRIAANHEGLRGATAGALRLSGNDLDAQLPRLFAGDLAPRTIAWLESRRSHGPEPLRANIAPLCPEVSF